MVTNELKHHGTKGMRWGVRRYQNKDGTLTPAGKKRYDKEMAKLAAEEKVLKTRARTQAKLAKLDSKRQELDELRKKVSGDKDSDAKAETTPKKKSLKDMTDDELRAVVNRMDLERRYNDLTPKQTSLGKKFIDTIIAPTMTNVTKNLLTEATTKVGKKALGLESEKKYETPDSLKKLQDEVKEITARETLEKLKKKKK